ncbi:MAG: hypothetical protein JOY68_06365 [Candidatus Dormibacteraeota bacterium]|nr:hypothetical protein [Candidatus Dormibacteraeota bacterium]
MRLRFAGVVPMYAWDTYIEGHGRMLGKILGLVTVANGQGDEFDIGELTTYVNDAVMLAPSLLLVPATTWSAGDDESFDIAFNDRGRTVRARVFIDPHGAPRDFSTEDRFAALSGDLRRTRWSTPVEGWRRANGRSRPTHGMAVWHLPDGPFPYIEGRFNDDSVAYNVTPGA